MKTDANRILREHGADALRSVMDAARPFEPNVPLVDSLDAYGARRPDDAADADRDADRETNGRDDQPPPNADRKHEPEPEPEPLETITPASWRGTEPSKDHWLAYNRIPGNDLTMFTGNGGAGKTETAVQLCINVAAGLGDWLGCVVESGPALYFSAEEQEEKLRKRVNRVCKDRGIDPDNITELHLYFPDLEDTTLVTADRNGKLHRTPLLNRLEKTIAKLGTRVVVIDSVAAVFDADVISRRQVRTFCAILRKIGNKYDTAIVLLDHPSVRGMNDGTGTSNSVDWRNGPRAMLYLSDPARDDPDGERTMEVKKNNDGPIGEQVKAAMERLDPRHPRHRRPVAAQGECQSPDRSNLPALPRHQDRAGRVREREAEPVRSCSALRRDGGIRRHQGEVAEGESEGLHRSAGTFAVCR
jgi:hypothetical protein